MFSNAKTLPSISALTSQHHPLSLSAPTSKPVPTGECRFILLHPSIPNQQCTCQCYHHNGKSGSACECGHQACYHVHTQSGTSSTAASLPALLPSASEFTVSALLERTRKLEQALENERLAREEDLKQERLARERETRIIREALHPFYRSESKLREKLVELEDRIEGNYDEQVRWMERLIEVDDAAMNLEKRFDEIDGPRPKRRRTGRAANSGTKKSSANDDTPNPPSGPSSPPRKGPSPVQENVSSRSPPHALAKSSEEIQNRTPPPRTTEPQYPRSSGILDSTKLPSALPTRAVTPFIRQSTPDSPRSSGLLDLAATPTVSKPTVDSATIGHTVLVTSTPLFHSSLAPMLDLDEQDFDLDPRVAEDVRKGKIREYSTERRKQSSDERAEVPDWNGAYQRPSTAYVTEMWKHKTNSVLRHDQPNPNKPHDRNQGQKQHGT